MKIRTALSSKPRGLIVAFLAAGAMVLTGCQGGGDPVAEPTSTSTVTSATPAPTPTSTAAYKPADPSGKAQNVPVPVKPALADENSKEGLEAFTKYWFELVNYGYETGDLSTWTALWSPGCDYCSNIKTAIDDSYQSGGWQVGALIALGSLEAEFASSKSTQQVAVQVIQEPTTYFSASGSEQKPASSAGNSAVVVVAAYRGGWLVDGMHPLR